MVSRQEVNLQSSTTGDVAVDAHNGCCLAMSLSLSLSLLVLSPASHAAKRIHLASGCCLAMDSASNDPHTICIACQKGMCTVENGCPGCVEWRPAMMASAFKYQQELRCKWECVASEELHSLLFCFLTALQGFLRVKDCPSHFSVMRSCVLTDNL